MKKILAAVILVLVGTTVHAQVLTTYEAIELNRSSWPYIIFKENGAVVGRIQGVGGNSFAITSTNGATNHLTVHSTSGNVGIGTAPSTTSRLDVGGTIAASGQAFVNVQSDAIYLGDVAGGDGLRDKLHFYTRDINRATIDENGDLGIGTSTPGPRLDVFSNAVLGSSAGNYVLLNRFYSVSGSIGNYFNDNAWLLRDGAGSDWLTARIHKGISIDGSYDVPGSSTRTWWERDPFNDIQSFGTGASAYLTINASNVGVGTTSPQSKLHIAEGNGGEQIRISRGTGTVRFIQSINVDDLYLMNSTATTTYMYWGQSGNVGIGTYQPAAKLHIVDGNGGEQIKLSRGTGAVRFVQNNNLDDLYLLNSDASKTYMYWAANGNVGIGTATTDAKLTVKGDIHTREVKVDLNGAVGPDYVFEKEYDLLSLAELEAYINQNKHLPEVPSAKEMEANGLNLKEMNLLLLKKLEELTLHLIEMKKENEHQQKEIENLKSKIN